MSKTMFEGQYPIDRFRIEEDDREFYENIGEVLSVWPTADEFEQYSEWTWSLDGVDGDGDSYHWGISCWFDYSEPCVSARLYRLYIGSGSPQKNPTHSVMTIVYNLDEDGYPNADSFDELCEILVEMLRRELADE